MGDEIPDLPGVVDTVKAVTIVESLLSVIRLQNEALVSVRPLLHAATVDIREALEGTDVPVPFDLELKLIDAAIEIGASVVAVGELDRAAHA